MKKQKRKGFTLIELLVVVLIIGILAAVAVPQYQKAVMKSRYSALMPIAKSISTGNEVYYMTHGTYATNPQNLDVAGKNNYSDGTDINLVNNTDYSYVIAGRENNFPMNYIVYQKHSGKFADNIHCEAAENNTMAQEVCQSLGGQPIGGSQTDGYLTYVLEGTVGTNDKLPTSLNKLGKNLCDGKTGCTYTLSDSNADGIDDTVTTQECGDSISYAFKGSTNTGKGCKIATYNSSGELEDIQANICIDASSTFANGHCVLNQSNATEKTYDENGKLTQQKKCEEYDSNRGGCFTLTTEDYENDIRTALHRRACSAGNIDQQTGACADGYTAWYDLYDFTYDTHGKQVENFYCNEMDTTTGKCNVYRNNSTKYNRTYDDNGVYLGYVEVKCQDSSNWTPPCKKWRYYSSDCTYGSNTETLMCNTSD